MHRRFRLLIPILLLLTMLLPLAATGQTATEFSEKDKKKMAEIALRPEIQDKIRAKWSEVRKRDMEYVFNVNMSSRAQLGPEQWAAFREKYGQLYDNPMLVRYVNSLGQRLVPSNSPNLYAFRLLLDPVPKAEALSTGTILISTGLVSLLDNEAQLAYILAHEIAHVERNHSYNRERNQILEEQFQVEKQIEQQKKRAFVGALLGVGGAAAGAAAGGTEGAMWGALAGLGAGAIATQVMFRSKFEQTEWTTVYENEADEAGLKYMLEQNYDAREVPRLYARLDSLVARDNRIGLGFVGSPERTRERTAQVQKLLTTDYKAEIEQRMKAPGLKGSSPEFALLMAALKRDNGVIAMDYDLFAMAKANLEDALHLRSNDPRVHYYLGQLMALTGRTPEDKMQAMSNFMNAIRYDANRGSYPAPHLEHALYLITQNDPASYDEIKKEIKTYVVLYQRAHGGALPGNMHILYDYLLLAGDPEWFVPPATVVTTKNVEPLYVNTGAAPATDVPTLLKRAVEPPPSPSVPATGKEKTGQ
jgi:hypothetical protein